MNNATIHARVHKILALRGLDAQRGLCDEIVAILTDVKKTAYATGRDDGIRYAQLVKADSIEFWKRHGGS